MRRASSVWLGATALLLGLALLSLAPEPLKGWMRTSGVLHRLTHFGAFFVAFLFLSKTAGRSFARACAVALALIAFAAALEYLQSKVYGNYLEYWDIRDDAGGVILAFIARQLPLLLEFEIRRRLSAQVSSKE